MQRSRALPALLLSLGLASPLIGFSEETPSFDRGAPGTWQKLLQLRTLASVLHITAHPDDEQGDVLTWLARGSGVRVALVSLTRGEAGANAIGTELFDSLGWVRAEELRLASRTYGLDALYFTRLADYGYSKRLEEAVEKWGTEDALADLVRIIRMERPWIVSPVFKGRSATGTGNISSPAS